MTLPNTNFANNYNIEKIIEKSDFFVDYQAEDLQLARKVIIREYAPQHLADCNNVEITPKPGKEEEFRLGLEKFKRKTQLISDVSTKTVNLVFIARVIHKNKTVYAIIVETENAIPLKEQIKHITEEETWVIFQEMMNVLEILHSREIIHGGINLNSIKLVEENGKTSSFLKDFYFIKDISNNTRTTITKYLKDYYAPIEQEAQNILVKGTDIRVVSSN